MYFFEPLFGVPRYRFQRPQFTEAAMNPNELPPLEAFPIDEEPSRMETLAGKLPGGASPFPFMLSFFFCFPLRSSSDPFPTLSPR